MTTVQCAPCPCECQPTTAAQRPRATFTGSQTCNGWGLTHVRCADASLHRSCSGTEMPSLMRRTEGMIAWVQNLRSHVGTHLLRFTTRSPALLPYWRSAFIYYWTLFRPMQLDDWQLLALLYFCYALLQRNDSEAGTSSCNSSSVSPIGSLCSPTRQTKKSARFRENVDIIYYDQRERPTSCATRDKERLKDECDTSPRLTEAVVSAECPVHGKHCHDALAMDTAGGDTQGNFLTRPIFHSKSLEIIKGEDGAFRWKMYVPIGSEFIRNKTSVKALSGGRKLILMAYKLGETEDGENYLHQYIEKLHLPHSIDAYAVKATMDKEGNLKINAPIQDDPSLSSWSDGDWIISMTLQTLRNFHRLLNICRSTQNKEHNHNWLLQKSLDS